MSGTKDAPGGEELRPLRDLRAPKDARRRIEDSVIAAVRAAAPVPWYRRRVSVPVPLAAAVIVALIVLPLLVRGTAPREVDEAPGAPVAETAAPAVRVAGSAPQREVLTDVFEIPGLGAISQYSRVVVTEGGAS